MALSSRLATSLIERFRQTMPCLRFNQCMGFTNGNEDPSNRRRERVFLNEVRLLGRVGRDPEIRGQDAAREIVTFPMVTSLFWRSRSTGEMKDRTDWHRIIIGLPSLKQHVFDTVKTGDRVLVHGSVQYSQYTDSEGINRSSTFISGNRVMNLTNRRFQAAEADGYMEADDLGEAADYPAEEPGTEPDSRY